MEKSSGTLRERRKTVERIVRNMLIQNLVKNFVKIKYSNLRLLKLKLQLLWIGNKDFKG
jgi:hypothetical protein